jgi:hypothetical protein
VLRAPDLSDVEAIDSNFVKNIKSLRAREVSPAVLANLTFTVLRSDDVVVPLVVGGAQKRVTEENLDQYCDLAEAYRRQEFDLQVWRWRLFVFRVVEGLFACVCSCVCVRLVTSHVTVSAVAVGCNAARSVPAHPRARPAAVFVARA